MSSLIDTTIYIYIIYIYVISYTRIGLNKDKLDSTLVGPATTGNGWTNSILPHPGLITRVPGSTNTRKPWVQIYRLKSRTIAAVSDIYVHNCSYYSTTYRPLMAASKLVGSTATGFSTTNAMLLHPGLITSFPGTVKPVYNDHLMGYSSAFWSSSRWPRATQMSPRRQKLLAGINW